jgi:hypothetical protein
MLYLIWPLSNIERELSESLYVITMPTQPVALKKCNLEYFVEIDPKRNFLY